jgi:hypothetical protein
LYYQIAIALNASAREGWLKEEALPFMVLAIRREQEISRHFAYTFSHLMRERTRQERKEKQFAKDKATCDLTIGKIVRIFGQNIANMLRSKQEDNRRFSDINGCHPPVSSLDIQ